MTFDALLANLRHASTNWWKGNKISLTLGVIFYYFNAYYYSK